jgi:2-aminoadipate transaminase
VSDATPDMPLMRYAVRTHGMTASEIRALFAVASRPEVVSLAGGMPSIDALDHGAIGELTRDVIATNGSVALQYGGGQGDRRLRQRLAEVMAAEGIAAHADELVVTTGGQQALDLVGKLFIDPGDVVIAEGPSYVGALSAFESYEAAVVQVPMDEEGLRTDLLSERLAELARDGRRPKFLYTVPNHQNPAGVSMTPRRRAELVDICTREQLLIVEDNPYGLLDFKGEVHTSLRTLAPERVIYVGTLSKILSPGIRVGWLAVPGEMREKLVLLKEAADLCQSNLTQLIAERWLATTDWQAQIDRFRDSYRERCESMLVEMQRELPAGCRWSVPEGGFFVWLELPPGIDARELLAKALNERVAYVPGAAFFAQDGGRNHVRLSFCFPTPERIREGIRRLAEVIRAEMELVEALYGGGR